MVALSVGPLAASTLRVPSQYPSIQAGLDAAASGDTVLVAPGRYTNVEVRDLGTGSNWTSSPRPTARLLVDLLEPDPSAG